jgi:hypothetical protein
LLVGLWNENTGSEEESMNKFWIGLALGMFLGISFSSYAASIVGNTPTLAGWTVTADGRTVCTDPNVNFKAKEIECEDDEGVDQRDFDDRQ